MIILDTNVISELAKADIHHEVEAWLDRQLVTTLFMTAISLAEVTLGIERLPDGRRKSGLRLDIERIFSRYFETRILAFDERSAYAYGRIVAVARTKGLSILMADGQIAAIAKVHGFVVATRDTSPFEAAGIEVINPWEL